MIHTTTLDAFYLYLALAPEERSVRTVAERYGLPLAELDRRAVRERWHERDECFTAETMDLPMHERHLRITKLMLAKTVDALTRHGPAAASRVTMHARGTELSVTIEQEKKKRRGKR